MMSEQDITMRLKHIGFKHSEIPGVMESVGNIIIGRVLIAYLPTLPETERATISSLPPEEIQHYVDEHKNSLPLFPQEKFDAIHDDTWREYFKAVG